MTAVDLAGPIAAYRLYVTNLVTVLDGQIASLAAAIAAGDLPAAESAWLAAHETWLRMGEDDGAYGAFGELGRQIDGTAAGLVDGTSDPGFTGFHKVELDLWTRDDLTAAATDTSVLSGLVHQLDDRELASAFPITVSGVDSWELRCHEILEDALRDSLSANDDYGSGTDLASVLADVAATREMLHLLAPVIAPRAPGLVPAARRELDVLVAAIDATRTPSAGWTPISQLSQRARERVDAATGAVLETVAPVSELLEVPAP